MRSLAPAALLLIGASAFAAEPATRPTSQPTSQAQVHAEAVAPFIDLLTVAVVHADISKVDVDAISRQILEWQTAGLDDPEQLRILAAAAEREKKIPAQQARQFVEAGGRDLYVILSLGDLMAGVQPPLIAPLRPGADPEALEEAMRTIVNGEPVATRPAASRPIDPKDSQIHRMHGAIVAASPATLRRLRSMPPVEQPNLEAAFRAVDGRDVQVLWIPSPQVKVSLEAFVPALPTGGGPIPIHALTRGATWAALGVDLPPRAAVRFTARSESAAAAQAMHDALEQILPHLAGKPSQETSAAAETEVGRMWLQLLPEVKGNRLVLALDSRQVDRFMSELMPRLTRARDAAIDAYVEENMKQLTARTRQYAVEHDNQWPDNLEEVVRTYKMHRDVLSNPRRRNLKPAYVYIKPNVPPAKAGTFHVLLHEAFDEWGAGVQIVLVNGTVAHVRERAVFDRLMRETRAANAGQVPASQPESDR